MLDAERLRGAVTANLPLYLKWLTDSVAIDSTADRPDSLAAAATWVADRIRELGGEATLASTAGNPVVLGRTPGHSPTPLLLYNHYDVQPADPLDLWHGNPYTLRRDGDLLIGRGTADNKGQLISRLAALHVLQELSGEAPLSLEWFVEGEEESGSPNVLPAVTANRDWFRADSCLWESGYRDNLDRYTIGLGAKGILYLELTASGPAADVHSVWGGMAPNPLWELVFALACLRQPDGTVTVPGFMDDVRQPSAHELEILSTMDFPERERLQQWGLSEFTGGRSGLELQLHQRFHPQINICGISGGYQGEGMKTVIPATARAKVDIRLVPHQRPDQVLAAVQDHLAASGCSAELRVLGSEAPAHTPPDSHLVRAMVRSCELMCGYSPPLLLGGEGSGPMHAFTDVLGIPVANGFGVGHAASGPHAPEENIRVSDLIDGICLVATLFQVCASTDDS